MPIALKPFMDLSHTYYFVFDKYGDDLERSIFEDEIIQESNNKEIQ